ncbi:hypothetical protein KEM55_007785 [Ascosphaera atra]|nr:hypothetical protein KEM55_007785 [Ascosphaera atra]
MKPGCQDKNGTGLGCPIVDGETQSGQDAGTSGTLTWQKDNLEEPGNNLTISSEGTCGISIGKKCQATDCCSSDGFCTTAIGSFKSISGKKHIDEKQGGATAVDNSGSQSIFWTWDPVELYQRKFDEIVKAKKLGGVMVWSLGQDSDGWTHIKKIQSLNQQANGKPVTTQGV